MSLFFIFLVQEKAFLCNASLVKKGDVTSYLYYYGKVVSSEQAFVYTQVPGKLLRYLVKEGDRVKKGDVIALLDRDIPGTKTEPVRIKSPVSGYVGILYLSKGEMVTPQVPVALVYGKRASVEMDVPVDLLVRIRKNADAVIIAQEKELSGYVASVSSAADPRTGLGKIRINVKGGLVVGDLVAVKIALKKSRDVLYVPIGSLVERKGKFYVFVYRNGRVRAVEVKPGVEGEGAVEVSGKLSVGDTVITKGASGLYNGARVRIKGEVR